VAVPGCRIVGTREMGSRIAQAVTQDISEVVAA
jgi:hypothetical protein